MLYLDHVAHIPESIWFFPDDFEALNAMSELERKEKLANWLHFAAFVNKHKLWKSHKPLIFSMDVSIGLTPFEKLFYVKWASKRGKAYAVSIENSNFGIRASTAGDGHGVLSGDCKISSDILSWLPFGHEDFTELKVSETGLIKQYMRLASNA